MPIGTWAPPTPEYLTAPGFATYAPTRAYAYSPTGGDWSGTYPSYGGGGGGGLTSGDFGGGADTSTLGGLLSAASVLGGANNLSSLLTGKSLLDHAGIDTGNLNWDALNPFSDVPLSDFFSTSFGPSDMPAGLIEAYQSGAIPEMPGGAFGEGIAPTLDGGLLSNAPVQSLTPPMVDAFPMVDPASVAAQPGNLGLPIDATQLYGDGGLALSEAAPTWAEQAQAIQSAYGTTTPGLTTAQQAAMDLGGIQALGSGATPTIAQQAVMDLGGIGATGFGAAPAFLGTTYLGAPMSGFASGALTGGALGGPGSAAAGSFAGAALPLALAMYGMRRMAPDPTADPRMANQLENYFQRALQGPEQEALELENLRQQVFLNPASIEVMKRAAEGGVPGAVHTSGGTNIVPWVGDVPAKFREFLPELERVAAESGLAQHGGMYNIGEYGLMGSPPNPYGENTRVFDPDTVTWQAPPPPPPDLSLPEDERRVKPKKQSYPDMFLGP